MKNSFFRLAATVFVFGAAFLFVSSAQAAIQINPPYDYLWNNVAVGPGAIIVLSEFGMNESPGGTDAIDKVGFHLNASTTMAQGEISRVSLWRESGTSWGFQIDEDIFQAGAAAIDPAVDGTLTILTPTNDIVFGYTLTKFYIVATTTSTNGITNGDAFDFSMDVNWASTTAGLGAGAAFVPAYKYTLEQSPNLKISEVKLGSTSNAHNEFVELYNTSNFAIDLEDAGLALHIYDDSVAGSSSPKTLTYFNTVIPAHSYFLIGSATNYSGSVALDATYVTLTGNTLISNGGLSIATSSSPDWSFATSTAIDRIAWGTHTNRNAETAATSTDLAVDYSFERKATTTATQTSMLVEHAYKGNGHDDDDNQTDFILRTAPEPQNSNSNEEIPFGGDEFGETTAPRVMAGYPSAGMTSVPTDLSFIGFNFTKPVDSTTVIPTYITLIPTSGGTNMCATVDYNPAGMPQGRCNISGSLVAGASYTFTVTTSVKDFDNVYLDQDESTVGNQAYTASFTIGSGSIGGTLTNVTPPHVMGTLPFPGAGSVPANIDKFFVQFDRNMNTGTLTAANVILRQTNETGALVSMGSMSFNATTSVLDIDVSSVAFTANTHYVLVISGSVQSTNGAAMGPNYYVHFDTSANDTTAPTVLGTMPIVNDASGISLNKITTLFLFDDYLDLSTATSGAVTLVDTGNSVQVPGTVDYDPVMKELSFTADNVLPANRNLRFTLIGGALKNISGTALAANYTLNFSTEAANSDTQGPAVMMVNADNFGLSVSFDEAVKESDAETLANYSLTVGSMAYSLSALAGQSIVYNTERRAAEFQNVNFPPSTTITVAVSGIRDISNNLMTPQSMQVTVMSFADSKGFLGPGEMTGNFGPSEGVIFTGSGGMGGFMPGLNIMPFNAFKSASSTYGFEMPLENQIPANGQIVISFPQSSDYDLACVATTSSNYFGPGNTDINGPGTGIIGIKAISGNNTAKTITLTLDTSTRVVGTDQHDFLHFDVLDIKNPSVPKGPDSGGYAVTVSTKDTNGYPIKTFNSVSVFINGGDLSGNGTTTIQGRVLSGDDGTTGLNGVDVILGSPMTGPQRTTTANNGYGGGSAGEFRFIDLPVGFDFNLFTPDATVNPIGTAIGYFGAQPQMIRATSTSIQYHNLTLTSTTSAQTFTVRATTGETSPFGASEKIEVWAGGPGQYTNQTITPGNAALTNTTLAVISMPQTNGMWSIGIGSAMPKDGMFMGPPPTPTTWIQPKPIMVQMSGCPGACLTTVDGVTATSYTFTITSANKTITGLLKDESSNLIAQGEVFAYSPSQMMGTHAQTGTDGSFTLHVTTGLYQVGAFFPGMGNTRETTVDVTSGGNYVDGVLITGGNPFILKIKKPAYTITGRVTDGTNAVPNAPVFAYRTDGPGHSDAMTNSSGNYTLYVDNGAWRIGGNIPGYGPIEEVSRTVSGANIENLNFRPTLGVTYYNVSGTVFEDDNANSVINSGEGIAGVMIDVRSSTGKFYHTGTGPDGTYNVRVAEGTDYRLELFKPDYGRIPAEDESGTAISTFDVDGDFVQNIKLANRNTITINVKNAGNEMMNVPELFIDFFDRNRDFGNHTEIRNASSTTIQIANASTTVWAHIPSVPHGAISVASDHANTLVLNGVLQINGDETVKIVINTNLNTITGTLADANGNALTDAWVELIDTSNGMHFGEYATTSTFSIKAGDGTYKIVAMKPRYMMAPQTLVVDGNETVPLVMNAAGLTISGTITAGGAVAENAFVRAEKVGGGFAATQADSNGVYTLNVDSGAWRIFAASHKYTESGYSGNPLAVSSSQTGINIALTSAANINDNMITSPSFTDTESGTLRDETVKVNVTLDANALGTAGSTGYMTAQETANYVNTPSVNIIGSKAKEIKAYAGGTQKTQLESGKKATVELTYTLAELGTVDTPSEVNDLKVAAWSDTLQDWESLVTTPTYKNSSGSPVDVAIDASAIPSTVTQITFKTTEATHFSPYALVDPNDPGAPATPSGVTATAGASGTNRITVSWSAVAEATGYYIYRDTSDSGSFALLTDAGNVTSYTNTGLTANTAYYYKVAAYKSGGASESAASGAVSAVPTNVGGGGIPGGGGGGGSVPTPTYTVVQGTGTTVAVTPSVTAVVVTPTVSAGGVSVVFSANLKYGVTSSDVKRLQQILNSDPDTQIAASGTGSPGSESEYFGSMTREAVKKFQKKHDIVSSGTEQTTGYGAVGPTTRAKLESVFGKAAVAPVTPAVSVSPVFTSGLSRGTTNSDVKRLQQVLNTDPDTQIATSGTGSAGNESEYFGSMTEKAVQKFQEKYNIAKKGDEGYGTVGPKTRAKIQEVFVGTATQTQTTTTSETASLESQIQALLQQVQALQAQLNTVQ